MTDHRRRRSSPKPFLIPVRFGDQVGRFRALVHAPARGFGAIEFQHAWLRETRGGDIDPETLEVLDQIAVVTAVLEDSADEDSAES